MENGYLQGKEMARYVQCHVIDIIAVYKIMEGVLHCQVLMWEVTPKGIELASQFHPCFEVAGQVTSIDIHGHAVCCCWICSCSTRQSNRFCSKQTDSCTEVNEVYHGIK